jgi:hypothetical protein
MSTTVSPGQWTVAAGTTTKIKVGGPKFPMRVFNEGPGSVFVKDSKTKVVLLRPGNSCDFEGTFIALTANDAAAEGTYDRLQ